jgi:hypothetical protein
MDFLRIKHLETKISSVFCLVPGWCQDLDENGMFWLKNELVLFLPLRKQYPMETGEANSNRFKDCQR